MYEIQLILSFGGGFVQFKKNINNKHIQINKC